MRRLLGGAVAALLLAGCAALEPFDQDGPATWALPEGFTIGAETTEFLALVTERACASGQTSEGRIVGPEIEVDDSSVVVTFGVRPLSGAQACPGNPATMVEVELDEPLGHRTLLDGGRQPPVEPPVCIGAPFCD
jgi:hypothetical protein